MIRNNADARRCSNFELGLPVLSVATSTNAYLMTLQIPFEHSNFSIRLQLESHRSNPQDLNFDYTI